MHMGNDAHAGHYLVATCGVERDHLVRAQSENHTRPSCQRGDSPNAIPVITTVTPR